MTTEPTPIAHDVFSSPPTLRGLYFSAYEQRASGLFTDLKVCDEWTYFHYPNGRYAIPLWRRLEILGHEFIVDAEVANTWQKVNAWIAAKRLTRDFQKGSFGCVGKNTAGYYFPVYAFPDVASAREFARDMGNRWIIAEMVDWVSMY